jgi:protein-disulfide isomerase
LKKLLAEYAGDLRIEWKDYPMSFHPRARPAATFARFAFETQGHPAFWSAHDALFEHQQDLGDVALQALAGELGLPWARVKAAIDDGRYTAQLDQSSDLATDFNVPGTPHFFINGRHLSGAQSYESFKSLVDTQLVQARALERQGVSRAQIYRQLMQSAQEPPPPAKLQVPALAGRNPERGPAHAKIVVHEFSDFQCPFCGRVEPTVQQIMKNYAGKIRLTWRNYPLPFHQYAEGAAEAAREAFAQGGNEAFWKYHDLLFQHQKELERADLERYATQLGLDVGKLRAALDAHTHQPEIEAESAAAAKAGVISTPAFSVNGYALIGAQPLDRFNKLMRLAE